MKNIIYLSYLVLTIAKILRGSHYFNKPPHKRHLVERMLKLRSQKSFFNSRLTNSFSNLLKTHQNMNNVKKKNNNNLEKVNRSLGQVKNLYSNTSPLEGKNHSNENNFDAEISKENRFIKKNSFHTTENQKDQNNIFNYKTNIVDRALRLNKDLAIDKNKRSMAISNAENVTYDKEAREKIKDIGQNFNADDHMNTNHFDTGRKLKNENIEYRINPLQIQNNINFTKTPHTDYDTRPNQNLKGKTLNNDSNEDLKLNGLPHEISQNSNNVAQNPNRTLVHSNQFIEGPTNAEINNYEEQLNKKRLEVEKKEQEILQLTNQYRMKESEIQRFHWDVSYQHQELLKSFNEFNNQRKQLEAEYNEQLRFNNHLNSQEQEIQIKNQRLMEEFQEIEKQKKKYDDNRKNFEEEKLKLDKELSSLSKQSEIQYSIKKEMNMATKDINININKHKKQIKKIKSRQNDLNNRIKQTDSIYRQMLLLKTSTKQKFKEFKQNNEDLDKKASHLEKQQNELKVQEDVIFKREQLCQCSLAEIHDGIKKSYMTNELKNMINSCLSKLIAKNKETPFQETHLGNQQFMPHPQRILGINSSSSNKYQPRIPKVLTDDYFKKKKFFTSNKD